MQPRPVMFVDLDLPETCRTKAMIIRNKPELARVVFGNSHVDPSDSTPFIETKEYILHPMNLTDIQAMKLFLSSGKMDLSLPTLFLSECVLIYIAPEKANPTLQLLQQSFPNSCIVVYEQIRPSDPFGQMMIRNLHVILNTLVHIAGTWVRSAEYGSVS